MVRSIKGAPLAVMLLVVSFLCPTEFSLYIADLRLPPHRVVLVLLLPLALWKLLVGQGVRLRPFDALFILYAAWTVWVYSLHSGKDGFVFGGSLGLESLGGYLVARAFIRTEAEFLTTLRVMMIAIAVAAIVASLDTLFGGPVTHDLLYKLTGYLHPTGVERRMGLTRAYGTFDHPIHYGTFCAALFAMFWLAERRTIRRWRRSALVSVAVLLGVSSAPLLCVGLQSGMLAWERLTRGIKSRVTLTLAVIVALYIGASLVSNRSPVTLIATGLTLDSWTGFYRLQIWEHGLQNVWASPMFGIGLADWERPEWMASSTVDAFWLVVALRSGIPAFLLLVSAILLIGRAVVVRGMRKTDRDRRRMATGWMMSLIALSLIACTVHYWNVLHAFFFFFLGLGGWLADPRRKAARTARMPPVRVGAISSYGNALQGSGSAFDSLGERTHGAVPRIHPGY